MKSRSYHLILSILLLICLWDPSVLTADPRTAAAAGDLSGTVVDPRGGTPIPDVSVIVQFADGSPTGIPPTATDSAGQFGFNAIDAGDYLVLIQDQNHLATHAWATVTSGDETILPPAWFVPYSIKKTGTVCGDLTDTTTGEPVGSALIQFRAGMFPPDSDPVLYTTQAGLLGHYNLTAMDDGVYTGFVSHAGYADGAFLVYALGSKTVCNQNASIAPSLENGEMRIVLRWGATPADLDSHLWAPHNGCESQNPFHLYYVTRGSHGCVAYFDIDLDDVTSYGPELTSIHDSGDGESPVVGQPYRFAVQDYSDRSIGSSTAMSNSTGLRVDALTAAGTQSFFMPTNTGATVWSVFEAVWDGAEWNFTPLNHYYYQADPSLVW